MVWMCGGVVEWVLCMCFSHCIIILFKKIRSFLGVMFLFLLPPLFLLLLPPLCGGWRSFLLEREKEKTFPTLYEKKNVHCCTESNQMYMYVCDYWLAMHSSFFFHTLCVCGCVVVLCIFMAQKIGSHSTMWISTQKIMEWGDNFFFFVVVLFFLHIKREQERQ